MITDQFSGMRDTSLDAYRSIKIELGKRQQLVYNAIKTLGCPTNLEISRWLNIPINQITPRTNELVKLGMVVEHERRLCSISRRKAISWRCV
jgi:hypothetical protein